MFTSLEVGGAWDTPFRQGGETHLGSIPSMGETHYGGNILFAQILGGNRSSLPSGGKTQLWTGQTRRPTCS